MFTSPSKRAWFLALAGLAAAVLSGLIGCAVGPDFVRPKPPPVERYTHGAQPATTATADGQAQRFEPGARIAADWWRLFNSPKLAGVISEALANNQSLQAAQASLRQSQATLRAGYGVFYPQIGVSFDAQRQKFSPAQFGSSAPSNLFNLFTLTGMIGYTLDVFGGNRRTVESLQAQVDYQGFTVAATYLTLLGNVVNTTIAQAAYRAEIEALGEVIGVEREQVRLTEIQAQAGTVPYSSVLSLRSQLAATEASLPPLEQRLSQANHLLATLAGHAPAEWAPPQVDLADISLPGEVPVSLPSELVRQRPDTLAAEALLHSASANIGVATAAMLPQFTLTGTYGLNTAAITDLVKKSSPFWSLGAGLTAPVFQGGTLWFQRQAAIEAYQQSLAGYRQTVLNAFGQVADTLRALEHDAQALQAQSQALDAAAQALRLVQANYQAGTVGYLQVLTATGQYQQARISYLQARAQRLQDTVALFAALGGGWWEADKRVIGCGETGKH
jgi:NodT family efflux transporter outer membrane factor (OMF) lipoprotein